MGVMSVISLSSGVALFMFGMLLIKKTLGDTFAEKSEKMLHRFTSGRFSSLLTGTAITAVLQSSSAVSVLTAAFADKGIISLYNAMWIIVGANLGTTFTGMLTAMSFSDAAPVMCVIGTSLVAFSKNRRLNGAGYFLVGFGLLFVGMNTMETAAADIRSSRLIYDILRNSDSPVTGLLTGSIFTALIQSSSAVTALLQTMAQDGIIGINQAFYIILGANIGTCATCLIASAGLGGAAKKVSLIHILYNFAGSVFFVLLAEIFPVVMLAERLFAGDIKMQIGFLNVFFNGFCALVMLMLPVTENTFSGKSLKNRHLHLKFNVVK